MVWQDNVKLIVMLCKLTEDNAVKCDRYWPKDDGESDWVEDFEIQVVETRESIVPNLHHVKIKIFHLDTQEERIVH